MRHESAQEWPFFIHFYLIEPDNIPKPVSIRADEKKIPTCSRPEGFPLTFAPLFCTFL
jgi:hypothetical protein